MLLVEPCDMVRQVNMLSLRTWGTSVCAVKTEDEAISRLKLRSRSSHHHARRFRVNSVSPGCELSPSASGALQCHIQQPCTPGEACTSGVGEPWSKPRARMGH